jgi:uncharacterized protein with HEPN domain
MTRRDLERLADIRDAVAAIRSHAARGDVSDGLIFDAVRVRLIEIGEAIKSLPAELLKTEPDIPWADIAGMRNRLAHRYFDTEHSIVASTIRDDLGPLESAVARLEARVMRST